MEIMINDFFIDKIIEKNHRYNKLELNEYLAEKIEELETNLKINFDKSEIKESFIEVCEKLNVFDLLSEDNKISKEISLEIIGNKIIFDKKSCQKISKNILKAYEDNFNVNKLYEPIEFDNKYETVKELINEDVFDYLKTNSKWQQKEAIGTINTFLEASKYTEKEIKKLYKKSQNSREFIKQLAMEINKSSLISSPFQIRPEGIVFKGKGAGLYDYFMYSEKSKKFALNFSTRSKSTEIDGESIFKHTLSALSILNKYSNNKNFGKIELKKTDTIFQNIFEQFAHYSTPKSFKEGIGSKISEKHQTTEGISKFQYQDQCIKGVNKRLPMALSETMKKINPDAIIEVDANYSDDPTILSISKETKDNNLLNVYLEAEDIEKLFDSIDFDFDIYYFGEVGSSKNNALISNQFTNEELRAGINILGYAGKNNAGIGGVKLSSKASFSLLEKINYRFNTSTLSNDKCLDIEKLNSNIRNIGAVFINQFMLSPNPLELISKTYEKESNQVLENISYFEKNILNQIIEGIIQNDQTPEQAYALTLGEFNITPKMPFELFVENLKQKWNYISDEKIDNGNSLLLNNLSMIVDSRKQALKQQELIDGMNQKMITMIDKMLDKGFSEEEIIKDNDFTTDILIQKFGIPKILPLRDIEEELLKKYQFQQKKSNN